MAAHRQERAHRGAGSRGPEPRLRRRGCLAIAGAVLLLVGMAAAPGTSFARRLPGDQVAAHLVDAALREWREWGRTRVDATDGIARLEHEGRHESDTAPFDARARVHRYWTLGTGSVGEPGAPPRPDAPWSAAFVSFLMQQIGVGEPSFVGDAAHARYLRRLLAREREAGDGAQFELLPAGEAPLKTGDLVCGPRNVSRLRDRVTLLRMETVDDLEFLTSSHCDVVVAIDRQRRVARAIGGNVFDSVAMTGLALTADGRVIRTLARPYFVVARPRRS